MEWSHLRLVQKQCYVGDVKKKNDCWVADDPLDLITS